MRIQRRVQLALGIVTVLAVTMFASAQLAMSGDDGVALMAYPSTQQPRRLFDPSEGSWSTHTANRASIRRISWPANYGEQSQSANNIQLLQHVEEVAPSASQPTLAAPQGNTRGPNNRAPTAAQLPPIPPAAELAPVPTENRSIPFDNSWKIDSSPNARPLDTRPPANMEAIPPPAGSYEPVSNFGPPKNTRVSSDANSLNPFVPVSEAQRPLSIDDLPPNLIHKGSASGATARDFIGVDSETLLQAARNSARSEDYATAIDRFAEYLRRTPDSNFDIRLELAGALASAGRTIAASRQIEFLLEKQPHNHEVIRRFADIQIQIGEFSKAVPKLQRLLQHPTYRTNAAIDLARIYAWTNRPRQAFQIYEAHLKEIALTDALGQFKLAELLTDLRLNTRAIRILLDLHAANPFDVKTLCLLILTNSRAGDSTAAQEHIHLLDTTRPEEIAPRNQLAQQLFDGGFYRSSLMIDAQIKNVDSSHLEATIRSSRANLNLFEPAAAQSTLVSVSHEDQSLDLEMAIAEYYSLVGEHSKAIAAYRRLLEGDLDNPELRTGLGYAYLRSSQPIRSAAEFEKVKPALYDAAANQGYIDAQLGRARALAESHMFPDAVATIENLFPEYNFSDAAIDTFVDIASKGRNYGAAAEILRQAIGDVQEPSYRLWHLRAKLGLVLARSGEFSSALQEFETIEKATDEPYAELVYGKYRALTELGEPLKAENEVQRHLGILSADTNLRVKIAQFATEDCDCCFATKILQHLDRFCHDNPIVSIRLGEACMQCTSCEQSSTCEGYFIRVINASASNVQAIVGLARLRAKEGNYVEACKLYKQILRHLPDHSSVLRESARMMKNWKGSRAATSIYQQAIQDTSGEHLFDVAQRSPERIADLEQDYRNLSTLSALASTENEAKRLSGWRPYSAIESFEGLLALEPQNQDAVFEIAQAYSQMGHTCLAIEQYKRLLCINPCHTEAKIALNRNHLEMHPQFQAAGFYRTQRGRNDLAAVDSAGAHIDMRFPLGDENEFFQFGYTGAIHEPPEFERLEESSARGRIQHKPMQDWLVWGQLEYSSFSYGFDNRLNFDFGSVYRYWENAEFRLQLVQENIIENGASVFQDINRIGFEVGNHWMVSELFTVDMLYRLWSYSDSNVAHETGIRAGYKLYDGQWRVQWITDFNTLTFGNQTIFEEEDTVTLGMRHPYFSPRGFWFAAGGLEVRRYFGCQTFKGSNIFWFEGYLGARLDSEGAGYGLARAQLVRDFIDRLTLASHLDVIQSSVYDLVEVGLDLTWRF